MLKKLLINLLSIGLFSQTGYSACLQPVTYVLIGTPAPCDGFIFTKDEEQKLRLEDEDYKFNLQLIKLKNQQIDLYKKEVADLQSANDNEQKKSELWRANAEEITTKYTTAEERQGQRDFLFTLLGVALTIGAGYAIGGHHK